MVKITQLTIDSMDIRDARDKHDLEGCFLEIDDYEIEEERLVEINSGTISKPTDHTEKQTLQPIQIGATDKKEIDGETHLISFKINFEDLWQMMYEHRQYAQASGFSDSEMSVLQAMRRISHNRITAGEIKRSAHTNGYSEGSIHYALNNLQEKDLIVKEQHGLYRLIDF